MWRVMSNVQELRTLLTRQGPVTVPKDMGGQH